LIHVFRLYVVAPEKVSAFISMFRDGGLYRELTRHLQPGLIAIDLLRSLELKTVFITQEFWVNEEAFRAAQNAPAQSVLVRLLHNMSLSCMDLGPFVFPPRMESDHQWQNVSTTAVAHCINDHGFEDA
jgi:heme-degrading monooxygenase HmoA